MVAVVVVAREITFVFTSRKTEPEKTSFSLDLLASWFPNPRKASSGCFPWLPPLAFLRREKELQVGWLVGWLKVAPIFQPKRTMPPKNLYNHWKCNATNPTHA